MRARTFRRRIQFGFEIGSELLRLDVDKPVDSQGSGGYILTDAERIPIRDNYADAELSFLVLGGQHVG